MLYICKIIFLFLFLFCGKVEAQVFERTSEKWILAKDSAEIKLKVEKILKNPHKKFLKDKIIKTDSITLRINDSVIYVYEKRKYYKIKL